MIVPAILQIQIGERGGGGEGSDDSLALPRGKEVSRPTAPAEKEDEDMSCRCSSSSARAESSIDISSQKSFGVAMLFRTEGFDRTRRLVRQDSAGANRDNEASPSQPPDDHSELEGARAKHHANGGEKRSELRGPLSPVDDAAVASSAAANTSYRRLTCEDDEGDIEYKWRLTKISPMRFEHLVTQMQYRVFEGHGQCLYELGVTDHGVPKGLPEDEFEESLNTIQRMAAVLNLDIVILQRCVVCTDPSTLLCGEILVSRRRSDVHDVSLAFCGTANSGISTLMGVLLTATLDDGAGSTRQTLFNHKHEVVTGHTTSIATRVLAVEPSNETALHVETTTAAEGFCSRAGSKHPSRSASDASVDDDDAVVTPRLRMELSTPPLTQMTKQPQRYITLMDVGGNITKTMLFGLMSRAPDYVCLCVSADNIAANVALHAQVCRAMGTSFLVVVTKTDLVEEFELDGYLMELAAALDEVGCTCNVIDRPAQLLHHRQNWLSAHHACVAAEEFCENHAALVGPLTTTHVPTFVVSSVSGEGVDLLRAGISHLCATPTSCPRMSTMAAPQAPFEVLLDYSFEVKGLGSVVCGRVAVGSVEVGCACFIGPDDAGKFYPVVVHGIHVNGDHVNEAQLNDEATFAIDHLPAAVDLSRKGKLLVREPADICETFYLTVRVLSRSLTESLEPILYTRNARQAVKIVSWQLCSPESRPAMMRPRVETEELVRVVCRFLFRPEVLSLGSPAALHWTPDGIAVGRITGVVSASTGERVIFPLS